MRRRILINPPNEADEERYMSQSMVDKAKAELEAAQSMLDAALNAWDASVSELWRTSLALTQAQKRVTRAHELLRNALSEPDE
jgi:exonuclease VII small subunit